jgi:hypothetical protein
MMPKKILALIAVLSVLIFFLGVNPLGAASDNNVKYEEKFSKTEPIAKDGKVEVKNISGDVEVRTWDRSEVKIDAVKVSRASSTEKAKENAQKVNIEVNREDGILRIESVYPRPSIKGLNVSIEYSVTIPSESSIEARSLSGDVTLENIGGKAAAETKSGDVGINGARNGARGETMSGDVTVSDIENGVYCRTASGEVLARNVSGNAELNCVSGDVTAENVRGDVEAETVSGSVRMTGISGADVVKGKSMSGSVVYEGSINSSGRYSLQAHSGRVEMSIPSGSAFDLDASVFSGTIQTDFEVVTSGKLNKKSVRGSVNGGGADVMLKTFSGNVYLKKK